MIADLAHAIESSVQFAKQRAPHDKELRLSMFVAFLAGRVDDKRLGDLIESLNFNSAAATVDCAAQEERNP